jgi:tetratricopeptide (TPR) repeat protein
MKSGKIMILVLLSAFLFEGRAHAATDAVGLYKAGNDAKSVEDFYAAIEKYKAALDANPAYSAPMIGLAECFLLLEEYDEAAKWASKANLYTREDPDIQVLDARIRIGQGDLKSARSLLSRVLSRQPNHLEARFASAEADIAEGRTREALSAYAQTLKLAPESKKAVLSLAIISDETGDQAGASRYFDMALRSHSADPQVQLAAGSWYARTGRLDLAEKRAQIALSLKPDLYAAQILLGSVYAQSGRYSEGIEAFRAVVSAERDNQLAWYGLGLAYDKGGDRQKALSSFQTGLSVAPGDEVMRIAQEYVALDSLKMDDPQRGSQGAYHADLGGQLLARNFQEKALVEYRRALVLDPTDEASRISYAKIWRSMGFPAKYLNELEVLAKLGSKSTFVSDEIEALSNVLSETVSKNWGIDQFAIDRRRYVIPVFTIPSANRLLHPMAAEFLIRDFTDTILRYDAVSIPESIPSVSAFDQAFRSARETSSDYFIVLSFDESERSFSATANLYLARTGERMASFAAFRTGNDRIRDCFLKIGAQLSAGLAPRGTLLIRKFDQGLIDLGTLSGVKKDDELVIVGRDKVRLDPARLGLQYDEADVLGSIKVTATDEGAAEGTVVRKGYFDFINTGDEIVYAVQKAPSAPAAPASGGGNILTRLVGVSK